jgi:hypothetical protein
MRQHVALIVGFAFAIGGGWFGYFLLFEAATVPTPLLEGAGFVTVLGCYLIWETFTDSTET